MNLSNTSTPGATTMLTKRLLYWWNEAINEYKKYLFSPSTLGKITDAAIVSEIIRCLERLKCSREEGREFSDFCHELLVLPAPYFCDADPSIRERLAALTRRVKQEWADGLNRQTVDAYLRQRIADLQLGQAEVCLPGILAQVKNQVVRPAALDICRNLAAKELRLILSGVPEPATEPPLPPLTIDLVARLFQPEKPELPSQRPKNQCA